MSASTITAAQAELISSLSQDDIPIKLRCAICSRLAVNAFRLPCCDQSICETCQSSLPSTCPVCEHSPVASEDCKPHKSLRTTIKVFLRTEEKKREALRLKEAKDATPPDTPIEPEPTPAAVPPPFSPTVPITNDVSAGDIKSEPFPTADVPKAAPGKPEDVEQLQKAQQDIPQPSIEEIAPGQEPTLDAETNTAGEAATGEDDGQKDMAERNTSGQPSEVASQTPAFAAGFGLDGSAAAGLPGAGFGSDMSQMQMMMAMQNGMAPSAFGAFPMMGMPGMNMDPMMMQNMFMNGGFGAGMGMNSMNMSGMGMGGFDGGVGGGFNNGWNGQQSWNVGPDNFNHPNAAGMGPGDYGANNSGYAPHAAGYNQGNYGRGNQYNNYQNNSFGYRGRGRGRGGYGRGGYGYGSHESFSQQYPQQYGNQANGTISETGSIPSGPKADATPAGNVDEFGREIRQTSEVKEAKETPAESAEVPKDDTPPAPGVNGDGLQTGIDQPSEDVETEAADSTTPKPIQTLDEAQASFSHQNGYPNNLYPPRLGYFHGSGGSFGEMQPPSKPVDVPINAPTGPKAMREGLPNTGLSGLRGRFPVPGSAGSKTNGSTSVAPEPSEIEDKEKEEDRSRSQSRDRERPRSRSRDRKRSRSRERHRSRRHRHRSTSFSQDEKETERRRQRRRERRRRREEEGEDRDDTGSGEKFDERKGDVDEDRSRSASPSDSKRSSHRSRRDKDKHRERERDSDREHRSSHKHRSSHRSHRDDRSRSRDRDRDREHRHRHSRRESEDVQEKKEREREKIDSSVPPTPVETEEASRRSSLISNGTNGIEIKGASIRRKNTLEEIVIPTGPRASRDRQNEKEKSSHRHREDERSFRHKESDKDKERERVKEKERIKTIPTAPAVKNPHEEEREARNRERLLKEAQRMAGLTGLAAGGSRKRSHDEGGEEGRRGKKKGRRAGVEESDEARIARLEAERESARW